MFRKQNSSLVIVYIILWFIDIRLNEMLLTHTWLLITVYEKKITMDHILCINYVLEYKDCLFVKEYIKMKSSDTS